MPTFASERGIRVPSASRRSELPRKQAGSSASPPLGPPAAERGPQSPQSVPYSQTWVMVAPGPPSLHPPLLTNAGKGDPVSGRMHVFKQMSGNPADAGASAHVSERVVRRRDAEEVLDHLVRHKDGALRPRRSGGVSLVHQMNPLIREERLERRNLGRIRPVVPARVGKRSRQVPSHQRALQRSRHLVCAQAVVL
eukprot:scaffold1240_cov101-Isochrysis_galbana.AAC.10